MKKLISVLFLFLMYMLFSAMAPMPPSTTYTSVINGLWTSGATWDIGTAPAHIQTDGRDIIIVNSTVTLNDDFTLKSGTDLTVKSGDTLIINGNATFSNGSFLTVESGGVLQINGDVKNKNNSDQIRIDGLMEIDGDFEDGTGSKIIGTGVVTGTGVFDLKGTIFGETAGCSNCSYPPSSLPVTITSFTSSCKNEITVFTWTTSSEINNDYFSLEHYKSDYENWIESFIVKGAGNSNSVINYRAEIPSEVGYFRLKQVDLDGRLEYSDIIFSNCKGKTSSVKYYPNPVKEIFSIRIEKDKFKPSVLKILNLLGQTVYTNSILSENIDIDVSMLEKGYYTVTIELDNVQRINFIKQ